MGFFTGSMIDPRQVPQLFPDVTYGFGQFLSNLMYTNPQGGIQLYGANGFNPESGAAQMAKTHLTVPKNDRLQQAFGAWQPWDGGTQYLADYITNRSGPNQQAQGAFDNMMNYGVMGGYPGQLMHNMAQYGGTGGAGNRAMGNALQFGAPSAAGQFANNMAQYGVASEQSGRPLANRAYGQQTPAMNYLAPFMQPRPQQFQNPFSMQAPQLPGLQRFGGYR